MAAGLVLAHPATFAVERLGALRVCAALSRLPGRQGGRGADPIAMESLIRRGFRAAGSRGECVPQAIVHYVVQSLVGPAPRLVIGIKKGARATPPLAWTVDAHAWVENLANPRDVEGFERLFGYSFGQGPARFDPP